MDCQVKIVRIPVEDELALFWSSIVPVWIWVWHHRLFHYCAESRCDLNTVVRRRSQPSRHPYKSYRSQRSLMVLGSMWEAKSMAIRHKPSSWINAAGSIRLRRGSKKGQVSEAKPPWLSLLNLALVPSDGSIPTHLIFTKAKRSGDSTGLQWLQEGHVLFCFSKLRVSSTPTVAKKSGTVPQDNALKSTARYLESHSSLVN